MKCGCFKCQWRGARTNLLSAPSPFDTNEILYACPSCKRMDGIFAPEVFRAVAQEATPDER